MVYQTRLQPIFVEREIILAYGSHDDGSSLLIRACVDLVERCKRFIRMRFVPGLVVKMVDGDGDVVRRIRVTLA